MSTIARFGLELEVLHGLLSRFMDQSAAASAETELVRARVEGQAGLVRESAAGLNQALLAASEAWTVLERSCAEERHLLQENVQAHSLALQAASQEVHAAFGRTREQVQAGTRGNAALAEAVAAQASNLNHELGRWRGEAEVHRQSNGQLGVQQRAQLQIQAEQVQSCGRQLAEGQRQAGSELGRLAADLERLARESVPRAYGAHLRWLEQQMLPSHGQTLGQADSGLQESVQQWLTTVTALAAQTGELARDSLGTSTRQLHEAAQKLSAQAQAQRAGWLQTMVQAQQGAVRTLEPAMAKAASTARQFPLVQHNADSLRRGLGAS
jgi:hypothetical protein